MTLDKVKSFYDEFKPTALASWAPLDRAVLNKLGLKADIEFGIGACCHSCIKRT